MLFQVEKIMADSIENDGALAEQPSEKNKKHRQTDMLSGPMFKKILMFALPLALTGILQQLFNSADMAVVYWFEGSVAQSAVNSNGALVNLVINLFTGLSVGVTVVVAEYIGKNKTDDLHSVTFTAVVMAVVCGVVLLGVGIGVSEPLLKLMDTPQESLALATEYLRIYFVGVPFFMVYDFCAAILRGVGDTKKALFILIATGVLNVGLNLLFVGVAHMGVAGVATATVICNAVSAIVIFFLVMRDKTFRICKGKSRVRGVYVKRISAIGLPAGLQGVVFSLANVLIQSGINSFGAQAVAGSGDAVNFEYYVYYFVNGFAQTTVTFFGQNYAAGNYARCKKIFRINMLVGLIVSTVLCAVFTLGADVFIRIYTSDEVSIKYAVIRMQCVLSGSMIPCFYEIAGGALRGMGHSLLPAIFTVIGSCVLRIIWIYTLFDAYGYYWLLMTVYPVSWVITGLAMMISYYIICSKAGFYKRKAQTENAECGESNLAGAALSADEFRSTAEIVSTANDDATKPTRA